MNRILENIEDLKKNHYVRKTDPVRNYWGDFSSNKINSYLDKYNEDFNLIIYGDPEIDQDYYIIPYKEIKPILNNETKTNTTLRNSNYSRWIFTISEHNFRLKNNYSLDISQFYGVNLGSLEKTNNMISFTSFDKILVEFKKSIPDPNLYYQRYITSLIAKPFVILTGNSGTGKTRISILLAKWLSTEKLSENEKDDIKYYSIVAVGANWMDNQNVLGFYNPISGKYQSTQILDLLIHASSNPGVPFFLILDEMNLSHVERYFSDFLSSMESGEGLILHTEKEKILSNSGLIIPNSIVIPKNLFITGTVNIDETTYMFSPKVLDRANVIEFLITDDDISNYLDNFQFESEILPADEIIKESFLNLANRIQNKEKNEFSLNQTHQEYIKLHLTEIFKVLQKGNFEFAYRTIEEIKRFIKAGTQLDPNIDLTYIFDIQILQKILPKLFGNRKKMENLLDELLKYCESNSFSKSSQKLKKMLQSLRYDGFVSFIQ